MCRPRVIAAAADLRDTDLWTRVEAQVRAAAVPWLGDVCQLADVAITRDGRRIAVTGTSFEVLEGAGVSRVHVVDVARQSIEALTDVPGRFPRWAPDGRRLAFLSDAASPDGAQVHVVDVDDPARTVMRPAKVDGGVESLAWSPDGARILCVVADTGADRGAVGGATRLAGADGPTWLPEIESGDRRGWRSAWAIDVAAACATRVSAPGRTVWEAAWCGPDAMAALVSDDPRESAWYAARLVLVGMDGGVERDVPTPTGQLGAPAASDDGRWLAVVAGVASDRGAVAGDVVLVDVRGGATRRLDTLDVDCSQVAFRTSSRLAFIGIRGLQTVAGEVDVDGASPPVELWCTDETASGAPFPVFSTTADGRFAVVHEGIARYPEIGVVARGRAETVVRLGRDAAATPPAASLEAITWSAPDGLEIQGLLAVPRGDGPHPLVVQCHGGPVASWRNRWALGSPLASVLAARGYAVLQPNPRGSAGRGRDFAARVAGDVGGADVLDLLAGVDAVVARGIADPGRVGVVGGSYGGYLACLLATRTSRFAAAVGICPVTDWRAMHWLSNVPGFDELFVVGDPSAPEGRYVERSPAVLRGTPTTPVLLLAGGLDRCAPAAQALQLHRSLEEAGCVSAVAVYPRIGHSFRAFPEIIDCCARVAAWFDEHVLRQAGA